MASGAAHDVTALLVAWSKGDAAALESLFPPLDQELRQMAKRYLQRERPDHTLQTTAFSEVYVRLIDLEQVGWQDPAHFFAVSADIMRRILVDHARARSTAKRGGGAHGRETGTPRY